MVAVLVLAALCEIFMGIYVSKEIKRKYLSAVILKGLASLFFVLIGLICSSGGRTANLIIAGLVLGFIADILLNLKYLLSEKLGDASFVIGAFVFLAGHIAYFAAILPTVSNKILFLILGLVAAALVVTWLFKRVAVEKALLVF